MPDAPEQNVDGISSSKTPEEAASAPTQESDSAAIKKKKDAISRARFAIIVLAGFPYMVYVIWSLFLLAVLPDASGKWDAFIPYARLLAMLAGGFFVVVGLLAFIRIGKASKASDSTKYMGFARMGLFIVPGIALSAFVPYWISQEPPLRLEITNPKPGVEFVAPLAISFSAEDAVSILARRGLKAKSYQWDYTGDGVTNEETVTPQGTAYFDRQGGYSVGVTIKLSDGSTRKLRSRVVIPNAVFSYTPFIPVVDEPIVFSVGHLIPEDRDFGVREIQWDFDEDGIPDISTTDPDTTHTFLRTGLHTVTVVVSFTNQTQNTFIRTIQINEPKPNPFPITIETTPQFLESPPPFQVVFRLETEEPLQEVKWDFDDNSPEEVGDRVGHTFNVRKVHQVKAQARNLNGEIAKMTTVVKVVERLNIPDLSFDGNVAIFGDRIEVEAPVAVTLTPKTNTPLIDFWWEAPSATTVTSTDTTLKAIYRTPGTYTIVLLAKDAEGRVLRKPITLEVRPKSQFISFDVSPSQGIAPGDTVTFDASKVRIPNETITGFAWSFGDDEVGTQRYGDAVQVHQYQRPGEYTVTLTVNTLSGRNEIVTQTVLVRAPFLKACFTMSRDVGKAPFGVLFTWTCSTGSPTDALWRFGDGAETQSDTSGANTKKEEAHVFTDSGQYDVELILRDDSGSVSTFTLPVTVQ